MTETGVTSSPKSHYWLLILILLLALGLRLGWGMSRSTDPESLSNLPDQNEYIQIAKSVLDGYGFVFYDNTFRGNVYAYRMPGYPLFLAACGNNLLIIRIVQSLLETSSVLAVYLIGRRLVGGSTGLLAALLTAIHPYLIYFSSTILSETLFTSMLIWGMYLLLGTSRIRFISGVVLLILSIYVRPSAMLLPALLAIGAQLVRVVRRHRSFWQIPAGTGTILLTLLCLSPWLIRNQQVLKSWILTTTNSGITFYDGANPRADGSSNQRFFRNWPELKNMGEVERSTYLAKLASDYALSNPARYLRLAGAKIARTWSPMPLSDEFKSNRMYVLAGLGVVGPLFLLGIYGLTSKKMNRSMKLYLLLPAVYFTAVHAMTVGSLRYRVPVDVPIAILAAAGAVRLVAGDKEVAPSNQA